MEIFAKRIKELRTEMQLSTYDIGKKIDVKNSTISRWENNKTDAKGPELVKLAKLFKVTTDYLLGLED